MNQPRSLEFSLAKAEYLLTRVAEPGQGGDKQNFWRGVMGFESAADIQEALLALSMDILQPQGQNAFGQLYRAYIRITDPSGLSRQIQTVWIVRFGEDVARFVTAVPDRQGGQK